MKEEAEKEDGRRERNGGEIQREQKIREEDVTVEDTNEKMIKPGTQR